MTLSDVGPVPASAGHLAAADSDCVGQERFHLPAWRGPPHTVVDL